MKESISSSPGVKLEQPGSLLKIIVPAWLLVGTSDILVAVIQSFIYGSKPLRMLQFIASGVFGKQAFSGGVLFALYGLVLHYCIAFIWVALFFKIYHKLKALTKSNILLGVIYGFFVWVIMNMMVMPLSNIPPPLKFNLVKTIISMLVIIGAIGLPLSFIANKYFSRAEVSPAFQTDNNGDAIPQSSATVGRKS